MSTKVASATEASLSRAGASILARVSESYRIVDLALALSPSELVAIRCVDSIRNEDITALEIMVSERDFVWAGLVHDSHTGSPPDSPIESFHLTELERLVARLRDLGAQDA